MQPWGCMLLAFVLSACATAPREEKAHEHAPGNAAEAASGAPTNSLRPTRLSVDVDRALPVVRELRTDEVLLDSRVVASVNDDRLRYHASWSLEPGEALSAGPGTTPGRLGSQRLGHDVRVRLPELAGSPLSFGVSSELRNDLSVSGYQALQHERARLEWAPGPTTVEVQWAGAATPFAPGTALACDLRSSLRLPTHTAADHSQGLTFSGSACTVAADDTAYAGVNTQAWGVGYAWERTDRATEALLSVIDPADEAMSEWRIAAPGYEIDLRHRRDFGALSAEARVSLREAPAWEYVVTAAGVDGWPGSSFDAGWSTRTSLTWNLRYADVSANWAEGVDRLWFTPERTGRSDRFGLTLNLSSWVGAFAPSASPNLAMHWDWSQVQLPNDEITGGNALRLDMALHF